MHTLGFDLALGNTDALDDRPPMSREQKKAQARAHAKGVRKERRGERRGRGQKD
jgi:23S rRNA pseudouridine955/2504/2580 synthase